MYSKKVSDSAIDAFEAKTNEARRLQGRPELQLARHPISECLSRAEALEQAWNSDTLRPTRALETDEVDWIQAERAICRLDFVYWLERYSRIIDWQGNLVPCIPLIAQRIMLEVWGDLEERGLAIAIANLKARQLGMTTISELAIFHRISLWPRVPALIGSSDPENSADMARKQERCLEWSPWWLRPEITAYRTGSYIEFGKQDSSLSIQWLNQKSGVGRGRTPMVAHLSEVSDCAKPEALIDAALLRAMHDSPKMFLILETTARRTGDWFHETWKSAVRGASRLKPVFLPWFIGTDLYPTVTWLRGNPVPAGWRPLQLTLRHADRARMYVRSNDLLRTQLGANWEMPLEQMWWWERTRQEYADKHALNIFYSELPADDQEAFQNTQAPVFDIELLAAYREKVQEPVGVFGILAKSDLVPIRVQAERREINPHLPPLEVRCSNGAQYRLAPLHWRGYSATDPDGKIFIWELPKDNNDYGFGADTGFGIGQDSSAVEVLRKARIDLNARQVAEFCSDRVSASDLAPICHLLGTLYSVKQGGSVRQCKAIIECNSNGETCQDALRKMGWHRWHPWIRMDKKEIRLDKAGRIGAFTVEWSRAMVLDYFIKAVKDLFIDLDSPWFLSECSTLGQGDQMRKLQAEAGAHDDRLMALAWAFFSMHVFDRTPVIPIFGHRRLAEEVEPVYDKYEPEPWMYDRPGAVVLR